jgi:hypothetical protein
VHLVINNDECASTILGTEKWSIDMLASRSRSLLLDRAVLPFARQSRRPALTYLVLLASADPNIAERLLRGDSLDSAIDHPHYAINLDAHDRAALVHIRARTNSVSDFLSTLADLADGVSTL